MALARSYELLGDRKRADAVLEAVNTSDFELAPRLRLLIWRRDHDGLNALLGKLEVEVEQRKAAMGLRMLQHVLRGDLVERSVFLPSGDGENAARRRAFLLQVDAEMAAFVGDKERALLDLQEGAEGWLMDLAWLDGCPLFDELRADPRFAQIRALVGPRAEQIVEAYYAP
jgi:serine/threonine-protein kinase